MFHIVAVCACVCVPVCANVVTCVVMFHIVAVCARICNHHPLADCRVRQFSHGQFKALSLLLLSLIMVISQLGLLANSINNNSATSIYFQMRKHR